jgi:hypothetical protein
MYVAPLTLVVTLGWVFEVVAQPPKPPPRPKQDTRITGVKEGRIFSTGVENFYGQVEKVSGRQVTLTCYCSRDEKPKSRTFEAIDVLAEGGLIDAATGASAYLWSDMKRGDTVTLKIVRDEDEDKQYCVRIQISGRIGGKVPESQDPETDKVRLAECNLLNDINNGLDVSDEDIAELFPEPLPLLPWQVPPPKPMGCQKSIRRSSTPSGRRRRTKT